MFSMPGPAEILVILLIVILLFGAKRLPKIGSSLGKGIRNFKNSLMGKEDPNELKDHSDEDS